MKKLFLSAAVISLLSSTPVFANDVNLGINIGGGPPSASLVIGQPAPQPVMVVQQPVFVERGPSYDPQHRDHQYWDARKRDQERREHERRERERHDHRDDHHGHDEHGRDDRHDHSDRHDDHDDRR